MRARTLCAAHARRLRVTCMPADLPAMALPPCHMFAQFYVADGELFCQVRALRCHAMPGRAWACRSCLWRRCTSAARIWGLACRSILQATPCSRTCWRGPAASRCALCVRSGLMCTVLTRRGQPGEFVHVIGDAHVYKNHVEPLRAQLDRAPLPFPKLRINTDNVDIDGFKYEDFELVGYECHGPIKMAMSV